MLLKQYPKTWVVLGLRAFIACATLLLLASCGGGGGGGANTQSFGALGTVSGLNSGTSVTLSLNGGTAVVVSGNGSFAFPNLIGQGGGYNAAVTVQPAWQTCTVSNGTGSNVAANVTNIAVTCIANHYAYVTNPSYTNASNAVVTTLTEFSIAPTTGLFTTLGTIPTGNGPTGVAVSANGNYVYVVNDADGTIEQYSLNSANGNPSVVGTVAVSTPRCSPRNVTTGKCPYTNGNVVAIVLPPNGKYAYIVNTVDNTVQQYSVSPSNGNLLASALSSTSTGAGSFPDGLATSPDGSNLYVANGGNGTVTQYAINSATGALSFVATLTLPANTSNSPTPSGIAFTPNGNYAYVTDFSNNVILQYAVSGGLLASTPIASVATGSNPNGLAISPDGSFVYVVNSTAYPATTGTTISYYSMNASSGALTPAAQSMDTTVPVNGIAIR